MKRNKCGQVLWLGATPFAVCTQSYGSEHDHDVSADVAVNEGRARLLLADEILFVDEQTRDPNDWIEHIWMVDDFDEVAPWMTLDERRECLKSIQRGLDCTLGITWETLRIYAEDYPCRCRECGEVVQADVDPFGYTCEHCGLAYEED